MNKFNPWHLVTFSPWPACAALSAACLALSLVGWFHNYPTFASLLLLATTALWFRDITRESTFEGHHSSPVKSGLMLGFLLFVLSELMLFASFFWAFFHCGISPSVELGSLWPPAGISPLNPWHLPLLNTILLLSSGVSITWAHHALISGNRRDALLSLALTISLGLIFSALQALEYLDAPFTFADSAFGSAFFATTGLHGLHVILGSSFLLVCLLRLFHYQLSSYHHLGFEAALLYWHWVDFIWLLVFLFYYIIPWC